MMKSLRNSGVGDGRARALEKLEVAVDLRAIGQHAERGRARRGVLASDRSGIRARTDRARGWRRALDLGDRTNRRARRSCERSAKRPRRQSRCCSRGDPHARSIVERADLVALGRENAVEDIHEGTVSTKTTCDAELAEIVEWRGTDVNERAVWRAYAIRSLRWLTSVPAARRISTDSAPQVVSVDTVPGDGAPSGETLAAVG